ncbi:MAG: Gfo/Idh/MocA family oxidoreductase [Rhodospirillaceae bacterium]|nr:Gfo/Idh/MocA family oxidoreductase [Rhodospirillaceae bacterium]
MSALNSGATPRVAFVGLGVMGQRMLANMVALGGFDPVVAWDPAFAACDAARKIHPGIDIAADPMAMIAADATDLVYIATPPDFHAEYAIAAAEAGKPVYCEKPLGTDVEDSLNLVDKVEALSAKTIVNFSLASAPAANAIADALRDGSLGDVQSVDIHLHFSQWPRDWQAPAAWLSEREQGGFVRETFSHYAYLTRRLFGEIELLSAITSYPDDDVSAETHAMAMMDCSGIPVTFNGGTGGLQSSAADRIEYTVWGSNQVLRLYDWNRLRSNDGSGWTEQLQEITDARQEGYRLQLENAGRFYRGEPHTMPSFRDALAVQELVEDILSD